MPVVGGWVCYVHSFRDGVWLHGLTAARTAASVEGMVSAHTGAGRPTNPPLSGQSQT